jgi:hypothetical protein
VFEGGAGRWLVLWPAGGPPHALPPPIDTFPPWLYDPRFP